MNGPVFREYDVVSLREGLSPQLKPGTLGVVVLVHDETRGVYEVEFVDDSKQMIEIATVTAEQIDLFARPDS